jgi:hypothetical protein
MKRGLVLVVVLMLSASAFADEVQWQRRAESSRPESRVFHSTAAITLPTAATISRGLWQFEVAHRFWPRIADGADELYGLDGPASMRLGLAYAPTDLLLVTLARSNARNNLELQGKYRILTLQNMPRPVAFAVQGGMAWNAEKSFGRSTGDSRNFQYSGQLIVNTRVANSFALGIVPSYLSNSDIYSADTEELFRVGMYLQAHLNKLLSVQGEWAPTFDNDPGEYDPAAVGIELETGGHFFKIFVTNSMSPNTTPYLERADFPFTRRQWRLGFMITRLLHF